MSAQADVPSDPPSSRRRLSVRRRGVIVAGLLASVAVIAVLLARPALGPVPSQTPGSTAVASAAPSHAPIAALFPTPATVDVVLLVGSTEALSAAEERWLADLQAAFGRVDTLAYRNATAERLGAYFTIFITDESLDLDLNAVISAYTTGRTIHLVGHAAGYRNSIAGAQR